MLACTLNEPMSSKEWAQPGYVHAYLRAVAGAVEAPAVAEAAERPGLSPREPRESPRMATSLLTAAVAPLPQKITESEGDGCMWSVH